MVDIKSIIKEQRGEFEIIEQSENLIEREKLQEAKVLLSHPTILAILGIRRCGKSIFSYLLAKNHKAGYINFDDERLVGCEKEEFDKILSAFYELYGDVEYIILDEVQNISHWELFVNRLRRTKKVIITGSNSKLLEGDLSTHLTGRYLSIQLFPFSFREYLHTQKLAGNKVYTTKEKAELLGCLRTYITMGGFPEAYKFGRIMISRIYEDIVTKDILLQYRITKIEELRKLANYVITHTAQEMSYAKLAEILKVQHPATISNWISYLEQSFLLFRLERFAFKLKQQIIAPKKFYCIDTGLFNSVAFQFTDNIGKLMENLVAIELQRRKKEGIEIYYWKDYQQHEVDFVIKEYAKINTLIQVTYVSAKNEVAEREIRSLFYAAEELRCKNLVIITWDYEAEEAGVRYVPLWKWLLA